MIQFISGIIASSVHVITGPDHIAAVTPLAIESRNKAWVIGIFWGLGHLLGMMLIGLLFYLFRDLINVDLISSYSEQIVGFVLIAIGVWAIIKVVGGIHPKHKHPHYHEKPEPHVHIHAHEHRNEFHHHHHHNKVHKQNKLTALSVGTLHGFAGISHFLLVLPTLTLPSKFDAGLYLSGFGIGTIGAMTVYAIVLGLISGRSTQFKSNNIFNIIRLTGGIVAIGVGIYWLYLSGVF